MNLADSIISFQIFYRYQYNFSVVNLLGHNLNKYKLKV